METSLSVALLLQWKYDTISRHFFWISNRFDEILYDKAQCVCKAWCVQCNNVTCTIRYHTDNLTRDPPLIGNTHELSCKILSSVGDINKRNIKNNRAEFTITVNEVVSDNDTHLSLSVSGGPQVSS